MRMLFNLSSFGRARYVTRALSESIQKRDFVNAGMLGSHISFGSSQRTWPQELFRFLRSSDRQLISVKASFRKSWHRFAVAFIRHSDDTRSVKDVIVAGQRKSHDASIHI